MIEKAFAGHFAADSIESWNAHDPSRSITMGFAGHPPKFHFNEGGKVAGGICTLRLIAAALP